MRNHQPQPLHPLLFFISPSQKHALILFYFLFFLLKSTHSIEHAYTYYSSLSVSKSNQYYPTRKSVTQKIASLFLPSLSLFFFLLILLSPSLDFFKTSNPHFSFFPDQNSIPRPFFPPSLAFSVVCVYMVLGILSTSFLLLSYYLSLPPSLKPTLPSSFQMRSFQSKVIQQHFSFCLKANSQKPPSLTHPPSRPPSPPSLRVTSSPKPPSSSPDRPPQTPRHAYSYSQTHTS